MDQFPRYFKSVDPPGSDMIYIRHDDETSDGVVVTMTGERQPNSVPWPLWHTLGAVQVGIAEEITQEEAEALIGEQE